MVNAFATVSLALVAAHYLVGGRVMAVTGPSMAPTLSPEYNATGRRDWVWANTRGLPDLALDKIAKGTIVAFWSPTAPSKLVMKRVVALPQEVVHTTPPYPRSWEVVPPGHVWVEGDDGRHSVDSNAYGPISMNLIVGRVTHVLWPWQRYGPVE